MLVNILLKDIIGHSKGCFLRIESLLSQVVAVTASEITYRPYWFGKHLKRSGSFSHLTTPTFKPNYIANGKILLNAETLSTYCQLALIFIVNLTLCKA